MRQSAKRNTAISNMHWTAKLVIKVGSLASSCLLFLSFFFPKGSLSAICLGQSATYAFAVSVIGGLFLDVVAEKMGLRKKQE